MMVERLIFFDIDGTLVPDTSTGSFIAKRLGSLEQMAAAERAYEEGRIDNGEVCAIDAASWCGYRRAEVESWLDELPLIAGIRETVDACRGAGVEPHLASLALTVVGASLSPVWVRGVLWPGARRGRWRLYRPGEARFR